MFMICLGLPAMKEVFLAPPCSLAGPSRGGRKSHCNHRVVINPDRHGETGGYEPSQAVVRLKRIFSPLFSQEITQLEAQVQAAINDLKSMGETATPEFWAKLAQVALQVGGPAPPFARRSPTMLSCCR